MRSYIIAAAQHQEEKPSSQKIKWFTHNLKGTPSSSPLSPWWCQNNTQQDKSRGSKSSRRVIPLGFLFLTSIGLDWIGLDSGSISISIRCGFDWLFETLRSSMGITTTYLLVGLVSKSSVSVTVHGEVRTRTRMKKEIILNTENYSTARNIVYAHHIYNKIDKFIGRLVGWVTRQDYIALQHVSPSRVTRDVCAIIKSLTRRGIFMHSSFK